MYYVYMLRSISYPEQTYIGFSKDLKARIKAHNSGQSPHTSKYKPWSLITYLAFKERQKALNFEKYLKSHSGKAFACKRLWSSPPITSPESSLN
ncbi:MAG: excinuclease ABC subunit C [Desulfobacteraceae bacterium 4572_123]|nr:MAG: excinuclease ABC subunit C [Desulfobacteraceae bacterium 4572_123]